MGITDILKLRPTRIRDIKMYLFKTREEKVRLSNVKNLITLAMADGNVDRKELAAIAAVSVRDNIDPKDIERMLKGKDKVKFVIPSTQNEKVRHLTDMVKLMMVDGKIHDNELELCKLLAIEYGYRHEVIDAMMLDIIAKLNTSE